MKSENSGEKTTIQYGMSETELLLLCPAIIKQYLINEVSKKETKIEVKLSFHGASSHDVY